MSFARMILISILIFLYEINEIHNEYFPIKTKFISETRLCNPWITSAVIKLIKQKGIYVRIIKLLQYLKLITKNSVTY